MRLNKISIALTLALLAMPLSSWAQEAAESGDPAQNEVVDEAPAEEAAVEEEESNLTWNLAATSDYVFRGITQTNFKPALQGGLDYAFGDSGFYVGAWGSNVDFADVDGPDIEVDTYVGFSTDISETMNIDLSVVHYAYLGEREIYGSIDYNEFFGKATWNEMITFTLAYSNNYSNLDYSSVYYNLAGAWEIGNEVSLNASIGHSDFSDDNGSYLDWNLGLSRQFGPVNAAINYYDTDISDGKTSDTLVLTLALGS